jgi:hypothetical protein
VVKHQQELTRGEKKSGSKSVTMNSNLSVLHQNIQGISNKQIEIDLVLKLSLKNVDVLCFTEHWVNDYLKLIQIDQYKLVSYFSRKNYNYGGSCIYVVCSKSIQIGPRPSVHGEGPYPTRGDPVTQNTADLKE